MTSSWTIFMLCSCSERRITQFLTIKIAFHKLWKYVKWIICLITELLIKLCTYTISKILRKVIIAHTRLWRYIDVVYNSQKCKGKHLLDRDRLLNINSTSIHISKKCCDPREFWEKLLKCCWLCKKSVLGLINMI